MRCTVCQRRLSCQVFVIASLIYTDKPVNFFELMHYHIRVLEQLRSVIYKYVPENEKQILIGNRIILYRNSLIFYCNRR